MLDNKTETKTAGQLAIEKAPRRPNGMLKRMPDVARKEMIEMRIAGVPIETIAAHYGTSVANAYWHTRDKKRAKKKRPQGVGSVHTSVGISKEDAEYVRSLANLSGQSQQTVVKAMINFYRNNKRINLDL